MCFDDPYFHILDLPLRVILYYLEIVYAFDYLYDNSSVYRKLY